MRPDADRDCNALRRAEQERLDPPDFDDESDGCADPGKHCPCPACRAMAEDIADDKVSEV